MKKKRVLAGVLSAAMVVGSLTLPENISIKGFDFGALFAQAAEEVASGTCGENLTWVLDDDGVLTISGSGEMDNYSYTIYDRKPWYDYADEIKSVVVEDGVENIGSYAFYNCTNLAEIEIMDSVMSIGYYAFGKCSKIESIVIPDNVSEIGEDAFRDCSSLTSIQLPSNLTSIGGYAFCDCISLKSIEIPEGVTEIAEGTFRGCIMLESIKLPDTLTYIDDYAFEYCCNLKSIEIPENVTRIGESSFYDCECLSSIVIPEGVNSIGMGAFYFCSGLEKISLPGSLETIEEYVFEACTKLSDVYYSGSEDEWGKMAIGDNNVYLIAADIHYNSIMPVDQEITAGIMQDTLYVDDSIQIEVSGVGTITYSSQNEKVAIVSSTGLITGIGAGTTNIIISAAGDDSTNPATTTIGVTVKEKEPEVPEYTLGDVNEDGEIDYLDAMTVLRYDAELIALSDAQITAADVNGDEVVDSLDAILILRYDADLIDEF